MRVLYFDCFSGASGDMILGALLDAGASIDTVRDAVRRVGIDGWSLEVEEVTKGGLRAFKARVSVQDDATQRSYRDVRMLLERAGLPEGVAERAGAIFRRLADAEASVHGEDPEDVHFHEAGALDAIVDVVGAAAALEDIAPAEIVVSPITTGRGTVQTRHGAIPVPAPAVLELLRDAPVVERGEGELITPTGAAILAASATRFGAIPEMRVAGIGYGAGERDLDVPNVLRVMVGEAEPRGAGDHLLIETNIDDMSPELIPHVVERLLAAGADDAWTTPIVMKKGRPAVTLSALAARRALDATLDVLYRETTTLGVRIRPVEKDVVERSWSEVDVHGYPVRLKVARRGGVVVNVAPEYEDARKVAEILGMPLKDVYRDALKRVQQEDL